jgi:hypothetical protein
MPIVVTFLVLSLFFGMTFPFAVLGLVGIAAIQAGLVGFSRDGYLAFGYARLTGNAARVLGGISIAVGLFFELGLVGFLIFGNALFP